MMNDPGPFAVYQLQAREAALLVVLLLGFGGLTTLAMNATTEQRSMALRSDNPQPARVYVNHASLAELTALPGIGAKKAQKIVQAREKQPLTTMAELVKAAGGIPKAQQARMEPFVSFER